MSKEGAKSFLKRFVFVFLIVFLILVVLLSISSFIIGNFGVSLGFEGASSWKGIFDKVRILFAPGDLTASLVASRTSCVAPCAVFFDATGTTDITTSRPFHDLDYSWSFGDPSSGNWATDGLPRNIAKGPIAGHVYETLGAHVVTLNARDAAGNTDSKQVTVTVTPFSGTTYYVSSVSGSNGNLGTNPAQPLQTFDFAMTKVATNTSILFKRGETFTSSAMTTFYAVGPGIIGAYYYANGSDDMTRAKPTINVASSAFSFNPSGPDWRIMDLKLVGSGVNYESAIYNGADNEVAQSQSLVLRLDMSFFTLGYQTRGAFYRPSDYNFLVDSNMSNMGTSSGGDMYFMGRRSVIMGNTANAVINGGEHSLRIWHGVKLVVSHNILRDPNAQFGKHALKFHADEADSIGSEYSLISYNLMRGGTAAWLGPQNGCIGVDNPPGCEGPNTEKISNIIVEKNIFFADPRVSVDQVDLIINGRSITIRNNIFDSTSSTAPYFTGVRVSQRAAEPPPSNVQIYNNLFYRNIESSEFYGISLSASASNTIVKNNLVIVPSTNAFKLALLDSSGSTVASNNNITLTSTNQLVNPSAGNYHLRPASVFIDAGASVPVLDDYDSKSRPQGAGWDIGAFENGTGGGSGEFCGNLICNATAPYLETCNTCSTDCSACPDVSPPSAPTSLTVTGIGFTQINLSWGASSDDIGVAGYRVWRNNAVVGTTGATTYSDNGLVSGTQYRYNVTAFDASGKNSSSSNSILQATAVDTTAPGIVSVTALTNTSVQVIFNEMVNKTSAQI